MFRSDFGVMNFKRSMVRPGSSWLNEMINAFIDELQELGEAHLLTKQQETEKQNASPRLRYPGIYH